MDLEYVMCKFSPDCYNIPLINEQVGQDTMLAVTVIVLAILLALVVGTGGNDGKTNENK